QRLAGFDLQVHAVHGAHALARAPEGRSAAGVVDRQAADVHEGAVHGWTSRLACTQRTERSPTERSTTGRAEHSAVASGQRGAKRQPLNSTPGRGALPARLASSPVRGALRGTASSRA